LFACVNGHSNKVVFSIRLRGEIISQHETTVATDGVAEVSISLKNPELWYPHGYGAQTLYDITVDVSNGEFQLDKFPSEQVYDVESSISPRRYVFTICFAK